ncbi:MAG: DUF4190 domain-containing protein [Candidatus Lokiarchaeota archaeon]|nr:DUF4190 domain-containing protein [Candidatus Lokiarchaeota archaeon]
MGKIFGILALVCGILGFIAWILLGSLPFGEFYLPGAAIVFGIIGLIADDPKGMAIAGLILGVIGIVFIIFILPILIVFLGLAFLSALFGSL